ncbi:MAG: hypothetical protein K5785_00925 [Nitrosarchaeum sp.]|nr:hypothetical protein [Nitrosarchaeum sp.]
MKKKLIGVGLDTDIEKIVKEELSKIHVEPALKDLKDYHFRGLKTNIKNWYNKPTRFVTIFGAAGEEDIPETKIKAISDHYSSNTRKMLNDSILDDPLLSPALDRRIDSIYEDGFHFELVPAIAYDPINQRHLSSEESEQLFQKMKPEFEKYVQQLETWKDDIHLIDNMRDSAGVSFAQGNAASLISPGIMDLQQGQLPFSVEIIHYSDVGEPIVDVGLTKKMVALKTKFENKKICRKDELVYITRNKRGYRKEGKYLGTSSLEPILVISRSVKRIYNYDIPEAIVAAYITKILFTFADGVEEADAKQFIQNFLRTGKLAFGMSNVERTEVVQPKVDTQMLDVLEKKLADAMLAVVGVPKSMLNREHNLNRDIATIEGIQFIKFVRKPDEQLLADEYEEQLINPLLAKQFGRPLNELPGRIKIVRNDPDKDLDTIFDNQESLEEKKTDEVNSAQLEQDDASSIFGASGNEAISVIPDGNGYIVKRNNPDS